MKLKNYKKIAACQAAVTKNHNAAYHINAYAANNTLGLLS